MPEPEIPAWTFSDRVRKIRRDYTALGQREFADEIGIAQPTYAAWESGINSGPRNDQLLNVARRINLLTGVPTAWILGLEGDELAAVPTSSKPRQ